MNLHTGNANVVRTTDDTTHTHTHTHARARACSRAQGLLQVVAHNVGEVPVIYQRLVVEPPLGL